MINQQAENDVIKIKTDLLSDTKWATSDAGLTTGIIAQNISSEMRREHVEERGVVSQSETSFY